MSQTSSDVRASLLPKVIRIFAPATCIDVIFPATIEELKALTHVDTTEGAGMDFSRALITMKDMLNGLITDLPDLILALMIFVLFYFAAKRTQIR